MGERAVLGERVLTIADRIVLAVGLLALGFGAWQAANSRPFELFVIAGAVLAVAALFRPGLRLLKFGPTGAELQIVEVKAEVEAQLNDTRQAPDLKLTISSAIFDVPWGALGTDHAVEVSAVNTSTGPIGVNSIGLKLTDGKWAPAMHQLPMRSVVELPGVLQPQQRAVAYWRDRAAEEVAWPLQRRHQAQCRQPRDTHVEYVRSHRYRDLGAQLRVGFFRAEERASGCHLGAACAGGQD